MMDGKKRVCVSEPRALFVLGITLSLYVMSLLITACGQAVATPAAVPPTESAVAGLPNPASVFCQENGGTIEMRQDDAGQYGVCVFADGSECEEWAYYRGECRPGESIPGAEPTATAEPAPTAEPEPAVTAEPMPTTEPTAPSAAIDTGEWLLFEHPDYGFSFSYPPDWNLEEDLRPQSTSYRHAYWLRPQAGSKDVLTIGFRRADEGDVGIQRTGVGAGDLQTRGAVDFLGQPLQRVLLIFEEKTMGVLYEGGAEITRGDMRFTLGLDYAGEWTGPSALGDQTQAIADAVVASFRWTQ